MIATEEDRKATLLERGSRQARDVAADTRYGAEIPGPSLRAPLGIFAEGNGDIAQVVDLMSELFQSLAKIGVSYGEWTHVHAAS